MEKNCCKTCGYCKFSGTENSPGGVMLIANYKCENPDSKSHGRVMNSITAHGKTLDSREKNSCEHWSSPEVASKEIREKAEERQSEIIDNMPPKSTINVEQSIGKKFNPKGDVSISDVDDSSSITIKQSHKGNSLVISGSKIIINGEETSIPPRIKNAWPNCVLQHNGEVYVNGFKYENGTFKRTLSSWLKCIFS